MLDAAETKLKEAFREMHKMRKSITQKDTRLSLLTWFSRVDIQLAHASHYPGWIYRILTYEASTYNSKPFSSAIFLQETLNKV